MRKGESEGLVNRFGGGDSRGRDEGDGDSGSDVVRHVVVEGVERERRDEVVTSVK